MSDSNEYNDEEIQLLNGRSVMNALAFLNYNATENELMEHIITSTGHPENLVQEELKRILNNGVTNGFLMKNHSKYLLPTLDNVDQVDSACATEGAGGSKRGPGGSKRGPGSMGGPSRSSRSRKSKATRGSRGARGGHTFTLVGASTPRAPTPTPAAAPVAYDENADVIHVGLRRDENNLLFQDTTIRSPGGTVTVVSSRIWETKIDDTKITL